MNIKFARAFVYRDCDSHVYAIYNGDEPIGILSKRDYKENDKLYCILDEFMISEQYQGKGYGKAAVKLWIYMIKNQNKYDSIVLCYIEGDEAARNLYLNVGFKHTGEADED